MPNGASSKSVSRFPTEPNCFTPSAPMTRRVLKHIGIGVLPIAVPTENGSSSHLLTLQPFESGSFNDQRRDRAPRVASRGMQSWRSSFNLRVGFCLCSLVQTCCALTDRPSRKLFEFHRITQSLLTQTYGNVEQY